VSNLRWKLGLKNRIAVDSDDRSGGLALFWHESVEVNLIKKNFFYIDVSTRLSPSDPWFQITFLWGAADGKSLPYEGGLYDAMASHG
jgi:hypothetical protein